MCTKCNTFNKHVKTLEEIIGEYPATKSRLQEIIDFLHGELSDYVDDVVERDFRDE